MTAAPIIIPLFLPGVGCREQCLFCNQKAPASEISSASSVRRFIEVSLRRIRSENNGRRRQVAFYGGSFTVMDREDQVRYLEIVRPFLSSAAVDSIRISTRPDALDEGVLALLKSYGVRTVEVGAQSMIDEVLRLSKRGHRAKDTRSAIDRLRLRGFEVGMHLMIGLPGDTLGLFLRTLDQVIDLRPDFVRVHPTLVLRGAPLEELWREGRYTPLSLDGAVDWLKKGLPKLEAASVRVARVGLQPTEELERDLLAGPYHPSLHQLVESAIFFDLAEHLLRVRPKRSRAIFHCHPKDVSNLRGLRNGNISRLKQQFNLTEILIHERNELPRGLGKKMIEISE